jgi:lipopolysaccharide export system permease protein
VSRLDRYLLSQLIAVFGIFSLILVSVYWVNRAIAIFDRLIADGQSALVFLEFIGLSLPNVILLVLPVSAFAASVYVTNRLTAESERVVAEAAGVSAARLLRGYIAFGLIVAALVAILAHVLVPFSRAELSQRQREVSEDVTARLIVAGTFLHPAPGITFYIRAITPQGELQDIFLHDSRNPGSTVTYTAQRAFLVRDGAAPRLVMFDGMLQGVSASGERLSSVTFSDLTYDMAGLMAGAGAGRLDLREHTTPALLAGAAEAQAEPARIRLELHKRAAQTLVPPVYVALGMAILCLGGFSRFGLTRQIVTAVFAVIGLWGIANAAEDVLRASPGLWPLVYAAPALGLALVALFLAAADRPALFVRRRPLAEAGAGAGAAP